MAVKSQEAQLFRAFHQAVPKAVREELYNSIVSVHVKGNQNKFEDLCILVLAYVASGKIPPAVADSCRDLLALVLHSISLRTMKMKGAAEKDVATAVAQSLKAAQKEVKRLEHDIVRSDVVTLDELEARVAKAPAAKK